MFLTEGERLCWDELEHEVSSVGFLNAIMSLAKRKVVNYIFMILTYAMNKLRLIK